MNFRGIIRALKEIGYERYLSAELWPTVDQDKAAKETIDYIRPIIEGRELYRNEEHKESSSN